MRANLRKNVMAEESSIEAARENLLYIRRTMEAAGRVTAVSGKSLMAAGFIALGGVAVNHFATGAPWGEGEESRAALAVWGVVLAASLAVAIVGFHRKSQRTHAPIQGPLLRKLIWSLCPALFTGALLTAFSLHTGDLHWLPVIWLACYGAASTSAGQFSVTPVRSMGVCFLGAAAGSALSPATGLLWLAIGFGWLHIIYGAYIARRYDG